MQSARPLVLRQHSASLKRSTVPWSMSRWDSAYKLEAAHLRGGHNSTIIIYNNHFDLGIKLLLKSE